MEMNLGPFALRLHSHANWTHLEAAFISNRHGGMARRESAINAGFKSEHLIDLVGADNPADTFECPDNGTLYFGKIVQTPSGTYAITAKEVYTRALYERACKDGLKQAEQVTGGLNPAA